MHQRNIELPSPGKQRLEAGLRSFRKYRWAIGGSFLLIAVTSSLAVRWFYGPEVVAYTVTQGDLAKTVVASGHVETPYRVEIGSQITGTVMDVLVSEGEIVRQGQPLVALDPTELHDEVIRAEGALAEAQARLRQMREVALPAAQEALKQAQATLVNAQASYGRAEQLARGGFGSQAALDEATRALNVAHTLVRSAQLQVYTSSPGGSDYVTAETRLKQAEAGLATARTRLGYATIRAPRDGTLISRSVERGTVVQPGRTLLVLAPEGDIQLVVRIDEKNLGLLEVGQEAIGSADAYANERFPARLVFINPAVDIARASVEVKFHVPDPPAYLRQDMTVSVDVEVDRRTSALIVPARVVHEPNSAAPFVLSVRDGRARMQPVTLGLRAGDKIQIVEGVTAGERLVPVGSGIRAGQRLRPVAP